VAAFLRALSLIRREILDAYRYCHLDQCQSRQPNAEKPVRRSRPHCLILKKLSENSSNMSRPNLIDRVRYDPDHFREGGIDVRLMSFRRRGGDELAYEIARF
jgi:hypothetical protein